MVFLPCEMSTMCTKTFSWSLAESGGSMKLRISRLASLACKRRTRAGLRLRARARARVRLRSRVIGWALIGWALGRAVALRWKSGAAHSTL